MLLGSVASALNEFCRIDPVPVASLPGEYVTLGMPRKRKMINATEPHNWGMKCMNELQSSDPLVEGKSKVERLFQFIRAFTNARNPIKRQLSEQPAADLQIEYLGSPNSSEWVEHWSGSEDGREWLLRVKICPPVPCEPPPEITRDWFLPGWERYSESARHVEEKVIPDKQGVNQIVRFADDSKRKSTWDAWLLRREKWAADQRRHDPVRALFSKLQALRAELQKRSEQVELVLGAGVFNYQSPNQQYCHPLVIKPLDIEFDSRQNCFTLLETERPTELYAEPLAELQIDLSPAGSWRDALQHLHPFDAQTTVTIKSIGAWLRNQPGLATAELESAPVIFLRDRGGWPARAATAVLADLAQRQAHDLPPYLLRLVGSVPPAGSNEEDTPPPDFVANEDEQILFALPANLEQLQLARQIESKDVVLVQGPPGTGKTHTIANLLGHLLSQGKRVLVTSHTSKALRVLRDKVPVNIQSLCVSVLDDASRSRRELEHAVQAIAERMQQGTSSLAQNAQRLERERSDILQKIRQARASLRLCIRREYDPVIVGGESTDPSRAAREVRAGASTHAWIPGPLNSAELGKVIPISVTDVKWLYASQARISESDELQLANGLPAAGLLPTVAQFQNTLKEIHECEKVAQKVAASIWATFNVPKETLNDLVGLAQEAKRDLTRITQSGNWLLGLVEEGSSTTVSSIWTELHGYTRTVHTHLDAARSSLLNHAPFLPGQLLVESSLATLKEITTHLGQGGGLKTLQIPIRVHLSGSWKPFLEQARCNDQKPTKTDHFKALVLILELHLAREQLRRRWGRQVEILGGPELPNENPEDTARDWLRYVDDSLGWFGRCWRPLVGATYALGRTWLEVESHVPPQTDKHPRLARAMLLVTNHLLPEWEGQIARLRITVLREELNGIARNLKKEFPNAVQGVVSAIRDALDNEQLSTYTTAYAELERLRALENDHKSRKELFQKLEQGAKEWSQLLRYRTPGFDGPLHESRDPHAAWRWRQLNDELFRRSELDAERITEDLQQLTTVLNKVTGDLIAARCWASQLSIAEKFRLHLVGWLNTMRKIGKGTGKNVDIYRTEARTQLKEGQQAVPVWIMPLAEVFRSLNVQESRFDVVIIDEASQAGIGGLLAAYMGKKVVVVGDHEQVSPDAVGEDLAVTRSLQHQYLEGFPNTLLYDGKLSLYDMSRWTASGMLSLTEHFRCLPAIIGFSNRLSYDGKIKPLRDPSSSNLRAVIPHRIHGAREGRQKINKEEALEVVSLIGAMCRHESYAGRSIGVVSLLGDDQAKHIENLLRKHIPVAEIEARKIICGNAAQFQGDERDVMLLSMVDSNEGDGPMRKVGDGPSESIKKRYNVAASRAQNQMWILHSMDYLTDLKPDDIRRELLEYAHVEAQNKGNHDSENKTESEFERLILDELLKRGYKVKTQYPVGYYRIDMVVEHEGRKLAIECDGERWHSGAEKIAEDLARQAVLERLGWRFHRIRGSLFFRDPDTALDLMWLRLVQLNIKPTIETSQELPTNTTHEELLRISAQFRLEMAEQSNLF
jgi:very-short-patch-repair endonuclease